MTGLAVTLLVALSGVQAPELRITMVGNAGVLLTDGATSLLVDLPYRSGAFGYMTYDPADLEPTGTVVSVITHHHADHFDAEVFASQEHWRVMGPPSVTEPLPDDRVLPGDSLRIGAFSIVVVPSPHTSDHRSYRVRWRGRILHFTGDTEEPTTIPTEPAIDLLFITPWLSCALGGADEERFGTRNLAYHRRPGGGDAICGPVDLLAQGASFVLSPGRE
jgi:L-ascorbate metabolism protein UlaG (beta-lactamase superfamily)